MTLTIKNQAFSNDLQKIKQNIVNYLEHNDFYNTFGNLILAKMVAANLTMKQLTFSHTWIAKQVTSKARKTPQRHIPNIISTGILLQRRRFKQTNVYTLHPYAQSQEFLEMLAPHFHEIKLYLIRKAKEHLRASLLNVSSGVQKVNCAFTALFNGGVPLFNTPSLTSYYYLLRQYKAAKIKPEIPRKGTMDDFRTKALAKLEEKAKLTPAGAIALAGYSDKVLTEAYKQFVYQRGRINKPFYWLSHVCKELSREYKEQFDYRRVNLLNQLYGIDDKEPKTEAAKQLQMADNRNKGIVSQKAPTVSSYSAPRPPLTEEEIQKRREEFAGKVSPATLAMVEKLWRQYG